ncbi:MAG: crossover junction endodeoxyribonuclease RuvC [Rhodobacteraceae bacterium]|nr:crossover junction endodeoxyribonuclease RuvC [Paracoccaceae bacterium]
MRVIGIDPGLRNLGWGVIDVVSSNLTHVANGVCRSGQGSQPERLHRLHLELTRVMECYTPTTAAVEKTFVNKDGAGTLKLGQARGVCLLVPAQFGLDVAEYAPNTIKKAVVGVGHAEKEQVAHMVKLQLPGTILNGPDATDALAIAMAHACHARCAGSLDAAVARALS